MRLFYRGRWWFRVWVIAFVVHIAGCSTAQLYEGGGDYRYIGASTRSQDLKASSQQEWFADWTDKYQSPAQRMSLTDKFQKGDTISIYLKSAMFAYITEGRLKRAYAENFKSSGKVSGQIAIIANVSTDQTLAPLVSPADASNPGRVIFYSGDVEENQMINQSFGPVYGPIRWDGGPIMLDVTVVEIDEEERKQTGAVISSLAKLGTAPGVNASPVSLALLNTLGSALVQSNRDDVMGRFRLMLTPDVQSSAYLPTLKEGDLVLIRKSNRDFGYPWKEDCSHVAPHLQAGKAVDSEVCKWSSSYNPATGHFAPKNKDTNKTNYMVFTFVRNMTGPDLTPTTTAAQLLEKIKAGGPNDLTKSIDELVAVKQKEYAEKGLQERLSRLADTGTTSFYRKHLAKEISLAAQCILLQSAVDAESEANFKTSKLASEKYCRAKETHNTSFALTDFDTLMRRVGEICEKTPKGKTVTDVAASFSREALIGSAIDFTTLESIMRAKADAAADKLAQCGVAQSTP